MWYKLKTAKNKHKQEFSCIEKCYDGEISTISIVTTISNPLVVYCVGAPNGCEIIYYKPMLNKQGAKVFSMESFDYLKLYTSLKMKDIPDKIIKTFMRKVQSLKVLK